MCPGPPYPREAAQRPAVLAEAAHREAVDERVQAAVETQQRQAEGVQDVKCGGGLAPSVVAAHGALLPGHPGRQQQVVGRQAEGKDQQVPEHHGPGRAPVCTGWGEGRARARGRREHPRQAHIGRKHQQEGGGEEGHGGVGQARAGAARPGAQRMRGGQRGCGTGLAGQLGSSTRGAGGTPAAQGWVGTPSRSGTRW